MTAPGPRARPPDGGELFIEHPVIQHVMQNPMTFFRAGPAVRVLQEVHVFKQDGTEIGSEFGISIFE